MTDGPSLTFLGKPKHGGFAAKEMVICCGNFHGGNFHGDFSMVIRWDLNGADSWDSTGISYDSFAIDFLQERAPNPVYP